MNENISAEFLREIGKNSFFHHNGDMEMRREGLRCIISAKRAGDPEATYLVARLILDEILKPEAENSEEYALALLSRAANKGFLQARAYLNKYCRERYREKTGARFADRGCCGPLVDFDNKPIRVERKGVFTPIDAVLEYKGGRNVLTLSTNVMFFYSDDIPNADKFENSVLRGLYAWEGEYEVFGGQRIWVSVQVTQEDRAFDNLLIVPITEAMESSIRAMNDAVNIGKKKAILSDTIKHKRSFATNGLKWRANSRKIIWVQSENGLFNDYEEIMHVAKHEFGHALGLGDLYESASDSLRGVEKGTYSELDSYAINDRFYNLVMCDHHGPISNNDIEMVILAFRENKMQLYQPTKTKGKISSALGKGN
ncbi:MAG: hypothetical protein IJA52_07280 [Clostridia bacterium]|nr:hypothetical protein [Clostridia bacterium]